MLERLLRMTTQRERLDAQEASHSLARGEIRHDHLGFYYCTREETVFEDAGHASVGFDLRPHFAYASAALEHGRDIESGRRSNY